MVPVQFHIRKPDLFIYHARAIEQEMNVLTPDEQEELGRLCRKFGLGSPNR